ncbi:arylamine N-acetyltransferase [Streptomyces sp. NPDC001339]|uniref:arylamine N-acetyltransferase family protein n=1 Tax=Streptomyces sp. NPDC001339 TaxID=3364563 RepID=UPI003695BD08
MTAVNVDAYLERIGAERPGKADLEALAYLQERHLRSVPFETFDFNLGVPVRIGEGAVEKIVDRRRGGGCYELNTSFAALLTALGYKVSLLAGRSLHNGQESRLGAFFGHMMLRVEIDGEFWLVDVGFRWASWAPLRFAERGPQEDANGVYRLADTPDGDVEVVHDGVHRVRLETRVRDISDFLPTMWWFCTSADSPVTGGTIWASLVRPEGRASLLDRTLTRYENGERIKEVLDDEAFPAAVERWFGIVLDQLPELPPMPAATASRAS